MSNALNHAISSAQRFGGTYEDYLFLHEWLDETKGWMPDFRHRAIRHHSEGIAEAVKRFDPISLDSGRLIPIRPVAERHVMEDLGRIPTAADWLRAVRPEGWMTIHARRLSREQAAGEQVVGRVAHIRAVGDPNEVAEAVHRAGQLPTVAGRAAAIADVTRSLGDSDAN